MGKRSTGSRSESRPEWEQLEDWVRGHVQRMIQELLEEEVTEFHCSSVSRTRGRLSCIVPELSVSLRALPYPFR